MAFQCLPLAEPIYLTSDLTGEGLVAEPAEYLVDDQPLSEIPLSLEEAQSYSLQHNLPLFLTPEENGFCAHPILSREPEKMTPLTPETLIPSSLASGLHVYGTPTALQFYPDRNDWYDSGLILGQIAEGQTGEDIPVFAQDYGGEWYLVGPIEPTFRHHLETQAAVEARVMRAWEENPLALLFIPHYYNQDTEAPYETYPPDVAQEEIRAFSEWLGEFDPDLYSVIAAQGISYDTSIPEDHPICRWRYRNTHAYFNEDNGIVFRPPAIAQLRRRDYEWVAAVLAHEAFHKRSTRGTVETPSSLLFMSGLKAFRSTTLMGQWGLSFEVSDFITTAIQCQIFPYRPGEEALAYIQTFIYADEKLPEGTRQDMKNLALRRYNEAMNMLADEFPSSLSVLEYQYIMAALPHLQYEGPESDLTADLFLADLEKRYQCHKEPQGECLLRTEDFHQLQALASL